MKAWKEVSPEQWTENAFTLIGKEWMLVAAEKDGRVNAMTAGWGGLGILWGKKVAFIFIRPQRFTKEFVDAADTLSLTFFGPEYREMLGYMGRVSGRQEDKIQHEGLTVLHQGETPYFDEARLALIGRKIYVQDMKPECILDPKDDAQWYEEKDYHTMYVVELEKVLEAE